MKKIKKLIFIILFIFLTTLISGISNATPATLRIAKDSPNYFKVDSINKNGINCSFIYESGNIKDNCFLELTNNTIFLDGKAKKIFSKSEALKNIENGSKISACLETDSYDVNYYGVQNKATLIVYNLTDNIEIDNYAHPQYYSLENKFVIIKDFSSISGDISYSVDAKNVFSKNGTPYDTSSILLWKDFPNSDFITDDYKHNMQGNYIVTYWLDSTNQIEKAFLINTDDLVNNDSLTESQNKSTINVVFIIISLILVAITTSLICYLFYHKSLKTKQ